jgi:hypothetical protein
MSATDLDRKHQAFLTSFSEIEKLVQEINDLDLEKRDRESVNDYKKRIEDLHLPLITKLEGVRLEWKVPNYSQLDEELRPDNIDDEVMHIDIADSPVKELINRAMSTLTKKI